MRKFFIENQQGSRIPLNGESGIFLSEPTGLGVTLSPSFADLHKGFFRSISGETEPQSTVACDLVFKGDDAYADYRNFVDWCSAAGELFLIYKPFGTTEFYRGIQINYLTKTELTDTRWLVVPTSLACTTPWYRAAPSRMSMSSEQGNVMQYPFRFSSDLSYSSSNAGSMAADLSAAGHIPASFVFTYTGAIINPKLTLQGVTSGKVYGICSLNATLNQGETLEVSTRYGESYVTITDSRGVPRDALESLNLAYEPFPRIPIDEDCTLYLAADGDIRGSATVRVFYYYRSV
jgi:hypothetical protein|nr:MAG TPA: Baseplate protein [Caudoviricetes sp.]